MQAISFTFEWIYILNYFLSHYDYSQNEIRKKGLVTDCYSLQVWTAFLFGYLTFSLSYKGELFFILMSLNSPS